MNDKELFRLSELLLKMMKKGLALDEFGELHALEEKFKNEPTNIVEPITTNKN